MIHYLWKVLCFFRHIIALFSLFLISVGAFLLESELRKKTEASYYNIESTSYTIAVGVVLLVLSIFLYSYKSSVKKTAAIANFAMKQKAKEELEKQNALDERRRKIREKIEKVGFVQKVKIAQEVLKEFPSNEYDQLKPMLTTESKKKDAIRDLNQKLIDEYEEALLVQFGQGEPFPTRQDYDHLLKDTMRLGFEAMLEQYGFTESSSGGSKSIQQSSREISDSGTWDDIKRRA
jgi:hypothetical protein